MSPSCKLEVTPSREVSGLTFGGQDRLSARHRRSL
jgi:hypothetical protein